MENKDIFNDDNIAQTQWINFNVVGDNIYGTLVGVREYESRQPGKEGEMVKLYEIKAEGGEFHQVDGDKRPIEPAIKLMPNEVWYIGGHWSIDDHMRKVRNGQKIGIKFTEKQPSKTKGYSDKRIKKVFIRKDKDGQPLMDTEWIKQEQEVNTLGEELE